MPGILRFILTIFLSAPLLAQTAGVQGRILDGKTRVPIAGVHVRLIQRSDTVATWITTTGTDGVFACAGVSYQIYVLEATFVGRKKFAKEIIADRSIIDLGDIPMSESIIPLGEVVVEGKVPPAIQKNDTTEFNARAFKTHPDADAGDLIAKMPGITVDNGSVKAHGEDVQQVLVDGKPFFGNDPTLALRNLPADAVEKIQVFDKMSDQAEFTGFDDGQSMKTINIVTRPEKRNQQFGKSYGGYGDAGKYLTGGGMNFFRDNTRLSVIGLSNNVNQQNFSTQDLLGVVGGTNQRGPSGGGGFSGRRTRGGGSGGGGIGGGQFSGGAGNFLVGQQNGVASTSSVGENYVDSWGSHFSLNQSYFFNLTDNRNNQDLHRQYFGSPDSATLYNENSDAENRNYNHRIDARMDYTADSSNSVIMQPRLYFQNNLSSSSIDGTDRLSTMQLVNQSETNDQSSNTGYTFSDHAVYRHRFDLPGRTISIDLGAGSNRKHGSSTLRSLAQYDRDSATVRDTTNQQSPVLTDGISLSSRLAYTEPVGGNGLIQLTYNPSYSKNNSDDRKYRFDPRTNAYSIPSTALSNTYENEYSTENAGIGYRFKATGLNLMAGVSYQIASLRGQQEFPFSSTVERKFYNILPNAMLTYNLAEHSNLRLFYRTSTKPPDISRLQDVIDNSNPLLLKGGNPDLRQSISQTLGSRLGITNAEKGRSLFFVLSVSRTDDFAANSTIIAGRDTVVSRGIRLNRGTQLTVPVNLDGNWNLSSFLTYALTLDFIHSNLNLTSGLSYARTPGLIDRNLNIANVSTLSAGAVIASNVSEDLDFTLSYSGNYSISRNTFAPDQNSSYFYHTAGVKLNLIFWEGIVLRDETSNMLYNGLSGGFNQTYVLWNVSLGKKLFANQRGEVKAGVTDLLNQNRSVNRTVTETYVEDSENRVLGRYVMLTFTYTLR
jgi:hypothetical protein